mmetsp:Transcript_36356/g.74113  ORF Transcript_36356/g.74113 Transcript_36356/m.74113 type:complete len:215 (-) Transcript_36356:1024-1668(-)
MRMIMESSTKFTRMEANIRAVTSKRILSPRPPHTNVQNAIGGIDASFRDGRIAVAKIWPIQHSYVKPNNMSGLHYHILEPSLLRNWTSDTWTLTRNDTLGDKFPVVNDFSLALNGSITHVATFTISSGIDFNRGVDQVTDVDVQTKNFQVLILGSDVVTVTSTIDRRNCGGNVKHEAKTSNGVDVTCTNACITSRHIVDVSRQQGILQIIIIVA